ncbi:MAG: FAD:protein FMN transferase, partial [Acidobacteriota bacterium]
FDAVDSAGDVRVVCPSAAPVTTFGDLSPEWVLAIDARTTLAPSEFELGVNAFESSQAPAPMVLVIATERGGRVLGPNAALCVGGALRRQAMSMNFFPGLGITSYQATVDPVALSPKTLEVFGAALELGQLTGGALDVTIAPLVEAWGFGPDGVATTAPEAEQLAALVETVGLDKLTLDAEAGTLRKSVPDLYCDLSSLAKGYAVDRVLERLLADGFDDVLVEIGGEVRTSGRNVEGAPWRLGIESPFAVPGQVQRVLSLENEALATSGDYRSYREIDGRRVSHLIDPRTGLPVEHKVASVSVVAPTCMRADALATALMVMGEDEGFELAEREGVAALFLVRDGESFAEKTTTEFQSRFPAGPAGSPAAP